MCLNHHELVHKHLPCFPCAGVVRVGSVRFAVLEPPRTSA